MKNENAKNSKQKKEPAASDTITGPGVASSGPAAGEPPDASTAKEPGIKSSKASGETTRETTDKTAGETAGETTDKTAGESSAKSKEPEPPPSETPSDDPASERDRYLRLAAEYDNYRKRSVKEREAVFTEARADTIAKLLPVYDNLERALTMECSDEAYYKGIEMTMTQLLEILEGMGVKPIPAVGQPFDPNQHNAVMTVENPDFGEKTVAEEFQKGFTIAKRVIRFSTVVVAN